jgi:hypothetical protein
MVETSGSSPTFPLMPSPGLTVDMVRRAFAAGDINALDSRGWTPLMYATQFVPSLESIKAILDGGQIQLAIRNRRDGFDDRPDRTTNALGMDQSIGHCRRLK